MPAEKKNPIRCFAINSPSADSAYLSITRMDGTTERFDLEYAQMRLLSLDSAAKLEKWPAKQDAS